MAGGISGAFALLKREQAAIDQQFAECATLLRSTETAMGAADRAEASRLLTAATDIAHGLGVDIGELFDELGLDDGAEERP